MKRAAVLVALLAAALAGGATRSQALFVVSSQNTSSSVSTAAVFNAVSISLADPGTPRSGTVTLSADATSDRPLASVTFETMRQGTGIWTTRCADTVAPYGCDWDTVGLTEGLYDVRATALDGSGYSNSATVTGRRIENTPPTVTLTSPGTTLTGNRTLTATAADTGGAGVASVTFEYRPSGGSWATICTDTTAAYSCSWATAARPDGLYDLRATALDAAGNTGSSTVLADRRVDNTAPTVSLSDDGVPKRGTATYLPVYGDGNGAGVTQIRYEHRPLAGGTWTVACTETTAPFDCDIDTTLLADGQYSVRAVATDGASFSTTSATITVRIDNTAPTTATVSVPAGNLAASVTLSGTGADAVGVTSMRFEYRVGAGAWSTACTDASSPFSCAWTTTGLPDASYEIRSVAIDGAGNTRNSASTTRVLDTGGPVVSLTAPATRVRGTVTIAATATDPSGVQSVAIQYRTAGIGAYTTICTDNTAAYSCNWNTAAPLVEGAYELRAVATDTLARQTTSAVVTTTVDRTSPTATDVQSTNGNVDDRLDSGDRVTFSYSEVITPSSILAGWTGASTTVTVRVTDNGIRDVMEFYDAANTTPLNILAPGTQLQINGDHISSATARFTATMVPSATTIRITLGALQTGTVRTVATGSNPMLWQPNELATNAAGRFVMPGTVTETGANDVDF